MLNFTPAAPSDVSALRRLARESEAHWGYDNTFMEEFDGSFNVTADFVMQNPVFAAREEDDRLAAFWGLAVGDEGNDWELEYFYVAKDALGRGYGRQMWSHMIHWCSEHKVSQIYFVTSSQAVGFYQRMGAVLEGNALSAIDGRKIPKLVYRIV